ncbi:hypothetical protein [Bacillus cereus]|uniref:hypothetical protein n=1 Tax=Bacillus cereus TaxID=1396 RepID=UPI00114551A4|nr:hypothetical protein [Bacillus cereus]
MVQLLQTLCKKKIYKNYIFILHHPYIFPKIITLSSKEKKPRHLPRFLERNSDRKTSLFKFIPPFVDSKNLNSKFSKNKEVRWDRLPVKAQLVRDNNRREMKPPH